MLYKRPRKFLQQVAQTRHQCIRLLQIARAAKGLRVRVRVRAALRQGHNVIQLRRVPFGSAALLFRRRLNAYHARPMVVLEHLDRVYFLYRYAPHQGLALSPLRATSLPVNEIPTGVTAVLQSAAARAGLHVRGAAFFADFAQRNALIAWRDWPALRPAILLRRARAKRDLASCALNGTRGRQYFGFCCLCLLPCYDIDMAARLAAKQPALMLFAFVLARRKVVVSGSADRACAPVLCVLDLNSHDCPFHYRPR